MWVPRFVDGQRVCSAATTPPPVRASPVFVGAATSSLLSPFCGRVADVRVYSRALSSVELRQLWGEMNHRLQVRRAVYRHAMHTECFPVTLCRSSWTAVAPTARPCCWVPGYFFPYT